MREIDEIKSELYRDIVDEPNLTAKIAIRKSIEQKTIELLGTMAYINGITPDCMQEMCEAEKDGRLAVLPCKIGDIVYRICKCEDIPTVLDGTLYGTATGYYCPYEDKCPHDTDSCKDVKSTLEVFEDYVSSIIIDEQGYCFYLDYTPGFKLSDIGKTVFFKSEEAERALKERD